jgi:hypothetical protein
VWRQIWIRKLINDGARFDTSGFEERQGHWWVPHRLLRHGTKACAAHEGPHDSPVRETRAADDPIDLLVELRVDGHAVILLVLDIANEGCVKFLESGVREKKILSLEINFQGGGIEDRIQGIPGEGRGERQGGGREEKGRVRERMKREKDVPS